MPDHLALLAARTEECPGDGVVPANTGFRLIHSMVHCTNCDDTGTVPSIPGLRKLCSRSGGNSITHFRQHPMKCRCTGLGYTVKQGHEAMGVLLEWPTKHGYELTLVCRPEGYRATLFALCPPYKDGEADGTTILDATTEAYANALEREEKL